MEHFEDAANAVLEKVSSFVLHSQILDPPTPKEISQLCELQRIKAFVLRRILVQHSPQIEAVNSVKCDDIVEGEKKEGEKQPKMLLL
jgi:hypothetical protein